MSTYEEKLALHENKAAILRRIIKLEASIANLKKVKNINLFAPGETVPCAGAGDFPAYDEVNTQDLKPSQLASVLYIRELVKIKELRLVGLKSKFAEL